MTESLLASLDASSSEADSGDSQRSEGASAPGAGAPTAPTGDADRNAAIHAPASGEGAGGDGGNPNPAEGAKDKLVPLAALHESREKIRALTAQIEELKKQPQLDEEDRRLLKDLKAQRAEAAKPKTPEFLEDPKGYIDAKEKEFQEAMAKLRESDTKRAEAEEGQRQFTALVNTIATHEQAFASQNPDYQAAINHSRQIRAQQLKMMFPQATDQQIQQQIGNEEIGGARQILQAGGNPAQFAYEYAKTLGYVKKVAPAPATNGATPPAPEPKPDKDAVRTLGGGGGAEGDAPPEDSMPEFTQALKERFTRKRK